ncbi:MAG TPA: hypothetical protein VFY71_00130 [Planctomycetota bacterium]|nr:hypothetical protein [Planctomycetota bacterium]
MSAVAIYVATLAVTVVVSVAVVLLLRPSLHRLLVDLCGSETRAAFWTSFSAVTLVLAPLLAAMHRQPSAGGDPVFELASQLEWALGGLLAAVLIAGVVLARSIVAFERERAATRRAEMRGETRLA